MRKVFRFEDEATEVLQCPMCYCETKPRPIEYDDKGNVVRFNKKKNKKRKKVEEK
jgi:hypothetical protein